jgi:hypothetical protein
VSANDRFIAFFCVRWIEDRCRESLEMDTMRYLQDSYYYLICNTDCSWVSYLDPYFIQSTYLFATQVTH